MKQILAMTILLCFTGFATAEEEPILNIYNWADYIDPSIIEDFEAEYGIKINYDTYDSAAMVDTKLLTGKSGYDLVMHAAANSARLIPIGAYQPVDLSLLSNRDNIDPAIIDDVITALPGVSEAAAVGMPDRAMTRQPE